MGILGVGGVETAALADDAAAQVGHEVLKKIGVKAERVEIDLSGALDHGDGEVTVIVILIGEPVLGGDMDNLIGMAVNGKPRNAVKLQGGLAEAVRVEELVP